MELVNKTKCGDVCRPGGLALTARMVKLCGFNEGDRLADIGCGTGTTLAYLKDKFDIQGIDVNSDKVKIARKNGLNALCASGLEMPFSDNSLDGILFECSFSKMEQPEKVLSEAYRVLNPNGKIAFSDFYAKNEPYKFQNLLGRCDSLEMWKNLLTNNGFEIITIEDYSNLLPQMWAQLVNEQGKDNIYANIGADKKLLQQIKCGYMILTAQKRG